MRAKVLAVAITANRNAFYLGKPNDKIIKDKSARKFINKWDIAVFRGGKNGILL